MFFTLSYRRFVMYAILIGALLAFGTAILAMLSIASQPELRSAAILVSLSGELVILTFLVTYAIWLQKYYYFYKLRRLVDRRATSSRQSVYNAPDGAQYSVTGDMDFFVITKALNGADVFTLEVDLCYARVDGGKTPSTLFEHRVFKDLTRSLATA